jgi:hypothetical protein
MDHQTTLIPWVQSIVIKHNVIRKEVLFWRQDNYVDLYRYLNDFIALYLTFGLHSTIGDDISQLMTSKQDTLIWRAIATTL